MALSKAMLDELTAGYKTPQELESLYSQMLQHMINTRTSDGQTGQYTMSRLGPASGVNC